MPQSAACQEQTNESLCRNLDFCVLRCPSCPLCPPPPPLSVPFPQVFPGPNATATWRDIWKLPQLCFRPSDRWSLRPRNAVTVRKIMNCRIIWNFYTHKNKCGTHTLGRDDFNLTFMILFGELPYDVGYQKKHIRFHGGGKGPLLYPAQTSSSWLNFFTRQKYEFFFIFFIF